MERNRWETAIRRLEAAVHPGTADDEVIAAVNGFRRTADGIPLSQVCIEFSCGGVPLADLARLKETLERLDRDNRELRRKLAVEEAAQASAERRLDDAYRRISELTEEALAAQRLAEAVERDFEAFRAAYAEMLGSARQDNVDLQRMLAAAQQCAGGTPPSEARRPFSAFLAEARLAATQAAAFNAARTGSGRLTPAEPAPPGNA
jgi:septal ring factor EnvC (AmiA/AmiB activator)